MPWPQFHYLQNSNNKLSPPLLTLLQRSSEIIFIDGFGKLQAYKKKKSVLLKSSQNPENEFLLGQTYTTESKCSVPLLPFFPELSGFAHFNANSHLEAA